MLLTAITCIRYVDDYLDTILWPFLVHNAVRHPDMGRRFEDMLRGCLSIVQRFAPGVPDELILLPVVECRMTMHPSDDVFRENIEAYIWHKSYDLYVGKMLARGRSIIPDVRHVRGPERVEYIITTLGDIGRSFVSAKPDIDFDLSRYLREHHIDPAPAVSILRSMLSELRSVPEYPDISWSEKRPVREIVDMAEHAIVEIERYAAERQPRL